MAGIVLMEAKSHGPGVQLSSYCTAGESSGVLGTSFRLVGTSRAAIAQESTSGRKKKRARSSLERVQRVHETDSSWG